MAKRRIAPRVSIAMAVIAFVVAAVPASGMVLRGDPVGRIIFAVVWVLVGAAWLGQFLHVRKSGPNE